METLQLKIKRLRKIHTPKPGEIIVDFRGEHWTYHGISSRFKVLASKGGDSFKREFNSQVFNGEICEGGAR